MDIYYENSLGEKLDLISYPYRMLTDTDLFNFSWNYSTQGTNSPKITEMSKTMVTKTIRIHVRGDSEENYLYNIERLMSHFDEDVISNSPGKLYVNGYFLECYVYSSSKNAKYIKTQKSTVEFGIVAENGNWRTSNIQRFGFWENEEVASEFLDYPIGYTYDYANILTIRTLYNDSYAPSNFILTIYGRCENPIISIAGHNYGSDDMELMTDEKLVINSVTKKIYKINSKGETENMFSYRLRDFYPFEKIPAGENAVGWNGAYSFEVELLKDRSEPKWT